MPDECIESWRPVPGWEARYQVSNLGRVQGPQRMRRLQRTDFGHFAVMLYRCQGGTREAKYCFVHRLVLLAFVGPCPDGMECRHLNGDPADNQLTNLVWGTRTENMLDRRLHGNQPSKLCEADVIAIRHRYAVGESTLALAGAFGVSGNAIQQIGIGKTWGWVDGPRTARGRGYQQGGSCGI